MTRFAMRWSETWRVLAYTAAIALAFIGLGRLELAVFSALGPGDMVLRSSPFEDAALAREAEGVQARSREALALVPGRQLATFRIGYELGYASSFIGSLAMSSAQLQAMARPLGERRVAIARELGAPLGLGELALLPVGNPQDYVTLTQRFEADESGLAARVEQRLSPVHRHLYLLGAQIGTEAATIESTNGAMAQPPTSQIRRHATLAGIAPTLWRPLAIEPHGEKPAEVVVRYRDGIAALAAELAARDDSVAASAPGR